MFDRILAPVTGSTRRSGKRSVFHEGTGPASGPFVPPD